MLAFRIDPPSRKMAKPITFGVEFEFALAYLDCPVGATPDPQETRRVQFPPLTRHGLDPMFNDALTTPPIRIKRDIVQTLIDAGFPAKLEDREETGPPKEWIVKDDESIVRPYHPDFKYDIVEITSPAYWVSESSVKAVEKAWEILNRTYCLEVNESTGLHCHVGCGTDGLDFGHVKHLVALLWAFEPQLASIHPPSRMDNSYCGSMRDRSTFARKFRQLFERSPTPEEGVLHFLTLPDKDLLLDEASCHGKYSAYNLENLNEHCHMSKRTIEFRQHEGSLDPAKVRNWILTVTGIVDWVRTAPDDKLEYLFKLSKEETWEKVGDGCDLGRELEYGPILAEGDFTIVDLLNFMDLYEPALYYSSRTYKHQPKEADEDDYPLWGSDSSGSDDSIMRLARTTPPQNLTANNLSEQSLDSNRSSADSLDSDPGDDEFLLPSLDF